MALPLLSVSWKDHSNALATVCKDLLENNFLVDCTITAEGQSLKAHRLVLSGCSPYFHMLFSEEREKHPILILKDVSFNILKATIDFVYNGEIQIPEGNLQAFLELAESLQIKGLTYSSYKESCKFLFGDAVGEGPHCTSNDTQDSSEVENTSGCNEDKAENSSGRALFDPPGAFANSVQTNSSVLFEGPSESHVEMRSTPEHYHIPHLSDEPLPSEITVKEEPLQSECSAEKYEQIDDPMSDEPLHDVSENYTNEMGRETTGVFGEQNLDQYSGDLYADGLQMWQAQHPGTEDTSGQPPLPLREASEAEGGDRRYTRDDSDAGCSQEDQKCICDLCGTSFTLTNNLQCHKRSLTHGLPHCCDECERTASLSSKGTSLKRKRTAKRPYPCDVCGVAFTCNSSLMKHMRIHTGGRPFKCDVCDAAFTDSSNLNAHARTHTKERPYCCDVCGASFSKKFNLKVHMRKHTKERPYCCDVCGASFSYKTNLKVHARTHTKERPYCCDECGAAFTTNGNLDAHARTHTGERPYRCDVCGASFTQKGSLKVHARTHTKERPYRCDVCGASFTQNSNHKIHMRKHTTSACTGVTRGLRSIPRSLSPSQNKCD